MNKYRIENTNNNIMRNYLLTCSLQSKKFLTIEKMMKNTLILFFILLTNLSYGQKTELKIYPVDESRQDSTLYKFVEILKEVIMNKDTSKLYNMLDENIISSFGGGIYGKQGFIETWELEKPDSSLVWGLMKRIIDMGGVFEEGGVTESTQDSMSFRFPYTTSTKLFEPIYKKYPYYDFDPYFTMICIKENVPVYKRPNKKSSFVGKLSYDVLCINYNKKEHYKVDKTDGNREWFYVSTLDKSTKGWILYNVDEIYFLAEYSLIIEKIKGEYKITGFFPYD
jgi:hypothetical protein